MSAPVHSIMHTDVSKAEEGLGVEGKEEESFVMGSGP